MPGGQAREAKPFQIANDVDRYRLQNNIPLHAMIGGCLLFVANALATLAKDTESLEARVAAFEQQQKKEAKDVADTTTSP